MVDHLTQPDVCVALDRYFAAAAAYSDSCDRVCHSLGMDAMPTSSDLQARSDANVILAAAKRLYHEAREAA
jgi:hypothetical protein